MMGTGATATLTAPKASPKRGRPAGKLITRKAFLKGKGGNRNFDTCILLGIVVCSLVLLDNKHL